MQVSTAKRVYDFGEPMDLNFSLSAETAFRANLFEDRLCDLRFIVTEGGSDLLSGYRNCVTSEREIPEQGFWDSVGGNERATYRVSGTRREPIGPDRPLLFTLHATATLDKNGRIFVRLAEDVYFEFISPTTVVIDLHHYRHPLFVFEDESGFGAYLCMERVYADDGEKLAIWQEVRQMGIPVSECDWASFAQRLTR